MIEKSHRKKWSKFQVSSFKFEGEGRTREGSRQEQKSDSNHFRDVVSREGKKKVIEITYAPWHTERREKKWFKSLSLAWSKEQNSDWNHFCDLAHKEEKKVIQSTFFGLAHRTKKWLKSLLRLGTQRRHTSDANHFFTAWRKGQKSDSNHLCDLAHREEKKVIPITFVGLAHRTKKWLKSYSRRGEQRRQKSDSNHFFGLAQRTKKCLKSLFGLGTQRRNKRDSNHFFKFQVSSF